MGRHRALVALLAVGAATYAVRHVALGITASHPDAALSHWALALSVICLTWAAIGPRRRGACATIGSRLGNPALRLPRRPLHQTAVCLGTWAAAAACWFAYREGVALGLADDVLWSRNVTRNAAYAVAIGALATWMTISRLLGRGRFEVDRLEVRVIGLLGTTRVHHDDVTSYEPHGFAPLGVTAVGPSTRWASGRTQLNTGSCAWDADQVRAALQWCEADPRRISQPGAAEAASAVAHAAS